MNPSKSQQVQTVLTFKDFLFINHSTCIASGRLLGDNQVCDGKFVMSELSRQNTTSLQVLPGVLIGQLHESRKDNVWDEEGPQGKTAFQEI